MKFHEMKFHVVSVTQRLSAVALGVALFGCSAAEEASADDSVPAAAEQALLSGNTFVLRQGVQDVSGGELPTDRPELSANGRKLVYSVEEAVSPVFILSVYLTERRGSGWEAPVLIREGHDGAATGQLVSWFFPGFTPEEGLLLMGKGTIDRLPDGSFDFLSLRSAFVELTEDGEEGDTIVTSEELGFPFGEIPQGARTSPDGAWLAFFAQLTPETQGIYLHHVSTGATVRVTTAADRDPVWSADGRSLFFYEKQDLAGEAEAGYLEELERIRTEPKKTH